MKLALGPMDSIDRGLLPPTPKFVALGFDIVTTFSYVGLEKGAEIGKVLTFKSPNVFVLLVRSEERAIKSASEIFDVPLISPANELAVLTPTF